MPLELIVRTPKEIGFVEYQDQEPSGSEVLVQTIVSGIKHGTEINMYRGTLPFASELWDPELRLFRSPRGRRARSSLLSPHAGFVGSWSRSQGGTRGSHFSTRGPGSRRMETPPNCPQDRRGIVPDPGKGRRGNDGIHRSGPLCTRCNSRC